MTKAWIFVGEAMLDEQFVFDTLPAAGTILTLTGSDSQKHELQVVSVEMHGLNERDWAAMKQVGGRPDITLYCKAC